VTIAADSRTTRIPDGARFDTECKISAFGNQFVFALVGIAKGEQWNAHTVARETWRALSKLEPDPIKLIPLVAAKWAAQMEDIYKAPNVIRHVRQQPGTDGTIGSAVFAATNNTGNLAMYGENIGFDVGLFDSTGSIRLRSAGKPVSSDSHAAMGLDEIANEFFDKTSVRATDYMNWFSTQLPTTPERRIAAISSKMVELTILLDPRDKELGFPIDLLQLRPKTGVRWNAVKKNCPIQ
jgi:hypothetical protein